MIYFIQANGSGPVKIGRSNDVRQRIASLQTACPYKLTVLGVLSEEDYSEAELHQQWSHHRINGEWFEPADEIIDFCDTKEVVNVDYRPDADLSPWSLLNRHCTKEQREEYNQWRVKAYRLADAARTSHPALIPTGRDGDQSLEKLTELIEHLSELPWLVE